ncbi:branched-chain amino acid ABC transporter permease [Arenibaculum sp.]|uniref:branched-chain amino acid ABC transporter permease n=1 Tax=Arenibaculum sp. TaxID=2865862 RepID=UPI002E0FC253|nr:branched-chain amino acid ABC transporter permease [Arenibaculum sp.]
MDDYWLGILANMGLLSFLALSSYVLLIGGAMSFGQQAFFGIGAYAAGMATVLGAVPLGVALALAAVVGGLAAGALGAATLRLRGFHFSVASLAAAEAVRISLELFSLRVVSSEGRMTGPNGIEGFRGIRYLYERGYGPVDFVLLIYGVLGLVLLALWLSERRRFGLTLRMAGEDPVLARTLGVDVRKARIAAAAAAGAIAALGGGLFAHYNTYVEPSNFGMMLGVHGLAYALIGGLGAPVGPLLGVGIDILLVEASRIFHGYRMVAFGGIVAVFLIFRPRGILDERLVNRLRAWAGRAGRHTPDQPAGEAKGAS